MSRLRWVKVTWPIEMRELGRRMMQRPFSDDAASGFIIDRIRNTSVEGRFIERVDFNENFVDPIGRELRSERVEFYQTQFIASSSGLGLEIIDSNKGTRFFVNQISKICDDKIALSSLFIDPIAWGQEFQKRLDAKLIADSMQISNLMVLNGVKAKVVLTGAIDVRDAAGDLSNGKPYRIEKLRLSTADKPKLGVVLSSTGTAATFGKGSEILVASVRDALAVILAAEIPV